MAIFVDRMEINYRQERPSSWDGIQVRVARTPEYARVDVTFIVDPEGMQVLERMRGMAPREDVTPWLIGSLGSTPRGGCPNCEDFARRGRAILLENQRLQEQVLAQSNRIQDLEKQLVVILNSPSSPEVLNNGVTRVFSTSSKGAPIGVLMDGPVQAGDLVSILLGSREDDRVDQIKAFLGLQGKLAQVVIDKLRLEKTEEPKQEPSRFGVLEVDELDSEEK